MCADDFVDTTKKRVRVYEAYVVGVPRKRKRMNVRVMIPMRTVRALKPRLGFSLLRRPQYVMWTEYNEEHQTTIMIRHGRGRHIARVSQGNLVYRLRNAKHLAFELRGHEHIVAPARIKIEWREKETPTIRLLPDWGRVSENYFPLD